MNSADGLRKLGTELAALLGETEDRNAPGLAADGDEPHALLELARRLRLKEERREALLQERSFQLELVLGILRARDQTVAEQAGWDFATDLQRSKLPQDFPPFPGRSEFDIHAGMVTAKEVGGDLYDFFDLGKKRIGILCADVSGKGIPAALMMANLQAVTRAHVNHKTMGSPPPPGHWVELLNRDLAGRFGDNRYATLFWAEYDADSLLVIIKKRLFLNMGPRAEPESGA